MFRYKPARDKIRYRVCRSEYLETNSRAVQPKCSIAHDPDVGSHDKSLARSLSLSPSPSLSLSPTDQNVEGIRVSNRVRNHKSQTSNKPVVDVMYVN